MTPAERERVFRLAVNQLVRERTRLMRATRDDLVALLKAAERAIVAILADAPTDYQRWSLPRLSAEIRRELAQFGEKGAVRISEAGSAAWEQGASLAVQPFEAAFPEARVAAGLQLLDTRQLLAINAFMTDRIRNIGTEAANRITAELGLVVIGARSPSDAITAVKAILGEQSRARATTIVRTQLGSVSAVAAQRRLEDVKKLVPSVKKIWHRSGKLRPRVHHHLAHGQVREVEEKFTLKPLGKDEVELLHPHDPKAPVAEIVNCGCLSLAHYTQWRTPGFKLLTREEHLKRQGLPPDPQPPGLEDDGDTLQQVLARARMAPRAPLPA